MKKNEIDVDSENDQSRSVAILIDLSQNLILRMSGRYPNQGLSLQKDLCNFECVIFLFSVQLPLL